MAPRMFADENAPPASLDRGALIGARLRQRRIELGMTARELARRVDCSPSLISQVERGRAVPSVSTLWALVTALRISMDRLFDPAQEGPAGSGDAAAAAADSAADRVTGPVLRRYARPRITLERGVVWERLTAAAEKDIEFLEVCYPVGQSVPEAEHAIQHTGQEYAVIVEGRAVDPDRLRAVRPGGGRLAHLRLRDPAPVLERGHRSRPGHLGHPEPVPLRRAGGQHQPPSSLG